MKIIFAILATLFAISTYLVAADKWYPSAGVIAAFFASQAIGYFINALTTK